MPLEIGCLTDDFATGAVTIKKNERGLKSEMERSQSQVPTIALK
jgi:hypothetical protein